MLNSNSNTMEHAPPRPRCRIVCDPAVHDGQPCFADTHLPIWVPKEFLAAGGTMKEVRYWFPNLTREDRDATWAWYLWGWGYHKAGHPTVAEITGLAPEAIDRLAREEYERWAKEHGRP